ncbi:MAG: alpha/beta hydrolase, partial [Dehalococcoidia bacterium]
MAFAALPITEVDSHRKTVTTNGLEYSFLEYGSTENPPVILLHGVWSTGAVWHDIAVALEETHHVRSVDFRGRSQAEWSPEGDYSTEAYVADVLGLYEAWGLEKATVIGHSMGGGVATALAAEHPERVGSLVVIDAGPVMRAGSAVEFERQLASLAQDFPSMAAARAWQAQALPNISDNAVERRLDARLVEQDGRVVWREDPRIRTGRGLTVRPSEEEMWKRFLSVKARTLFVLGGNSQLVTDEVEKRLTS